MPPKPKTKQKKTPLTSPLPRPRRQVPTKCEPGCACGPGLYEDANGQCVPPEACPCEFAGTSYAPGALLHADCQAW